MADVRVWGADGGDFVDGKLVWSALNALRAAKESAPPVVDLSDLLHARPYTVAAVAALGALSHRKAELRLPTTQDARDFVLRCGLGDFFDAASLALSPSPRNVRVTQLQAVSPSFADEISEAWEREFGSMPAGLRHQLAGHLDELMLNALAHADSPVGCIIAAQV